MKSWRAHSVAAAGAVSLWLAGMSPCAAAPDQPAAVPGSDLPARLLALLKPALPAPPAVARIKDFLDRGIAEAKAHPQMLRVRGVVTCVAPDERWFFVQDDSAGMMVMLSAAGPKPALGQQVTVEGRTTGGTTAPFLSEAMATIEGPAALPAPLAATPADAAAQKPFGQWIEVEGILRETYRLKDGTIHMEIVRGSGSCSVNLHGDAQTFMDADLAGARVAARGVCWAYYNGHLQVQHPAENLRILARPAQPRFAQPPVPAATLRGSTGETLSLVRGTLLMTDFMGRWRLLCDDGTTLQAVPAKLWDGRVSREQHAAVKQGARVLIEGLVTDESGYLTARHAYIREQGPAPPLPEPPVLTPGGADRPERAGQLITVTGILGDIELRTTRQYLPPYAAVNYSLAVLENEQDHTRVHLIIPPDCVARLKSLPAHRLVQVTGCQLPAAVAGTPLPQVWARTVQDFASGGLTRAALRGYTLWGAGGLTVLVLIAAGFLWALREKLRRQRSEAAIISAHNATLETRVAERTAELAAANERLSRASQEALSNLERERELGALKSSFTSMVSHEFRTPLAVILASADLLHNHLDKLPPALRAEQIASIRASTKLMARLIEDVLLLGKVEAGRMSFLPVDISLRGLCSELVDEAHSATSRRCPIELTVDDHLPDHLQVDPALLRHIFSNLLSNAVKYSPENTPVSFTATQEQDRIVFHITDHGIGIPEADLPHLFEAFHRAKNVGQTSGTGLGLMITRRCVELHRGTIDIHSQPGTGTTVRVSLPLILLIEDHPQMREKISLMLQLNDYSVTTAENGRIGIELAISSPPDVILCDIMMPELDGYAVLAAVREDPDLNTIPFIFLTAKGEKQDLRAGMNLGADDYLSKPISETDLLAALEARFQRLHTLRQKQSAYRPDFTTHKPLLKLGLTEREAEVLLWVAQGKSSPDIALILGVSDTTAKKHVCNLLAKLGCENRNAAALQALEALSN